MLPIQLSLCSSSSKREMKRFHPNRAVAIAIFCLICGFSMFAQTATQQKSSDKKQNATTAANDSTTTKLPPPVTERYDTNQGTGPSTEPILPVPPMPKSTTTLIGGTVESVDHVRDHLTVKPFGGKKISVHFDQRTHIYRDGVETTQLAIKKNERVYVDTQLDRSEVLARNIRLITQENAADARGQVLTASNGQLSIRDVLSGESVDLATNAKTRVFRDGTEVPISQVTPGSLITVQFVPGQENRGVAQEIKLLAAPGSVFTFAGQVTNLDLSQEMMSIANQSDNRTYDITVLQHVVPGNLMVGSDVVVKATFDGKQYRANSVDVTKARTDK